MNDLVLRIAQWMPVELARLVVALAILVLGVVVASIGKAIVVRLLRRVNARLLSLTSTLGGSRGAAVEQANAAQTAASSVAARLVFWAIFVLFLAAATSLLGFPVVSTWFASLADYLPHVVAAVAIILLGILFGLVLRVTVTGAALSAKFLHARELGRAVQVSIVALSVVVAIEELGIRVTFLVVVAATVLGAALGGAALAFGLGARRSVENLLASHYLSKWYRQGDTVRIGEHVGEIAKILPSAVILRTGRGSVYVPSGEFARATSSQVIEEHAE